MRKNFLAMAVAAVGLVAIAGAAQAQPYQLTLAGASPGGLWSNLGIGMDQVMKAAYPGSTVTYQTTGGGFANAVLLQQKKVPIGIIHNVELRMAQNGVEPFKAPVTDIRPLAYLYDWSPFQLLLTKEFADKHGIKTFEDLITKKAPVRMVLNRRGNVAHDVAISMMKANGASLDDVKAWGGNVVLAGSEEQSDLMKDRRVDMIFNSLFVGIRSLVEVGTSVNVIMLPVGKETVEKVGKEMGTDPYVIKGGSYAFQPNDVSTLTMGAFIAANKDMPDAQAQAITKALIEKVDAMRGVHPSMKELTPKLMPSLANNFPYHPGAIAAYKAAGLM
ncbi:MAG TPA: TAXI family TRAP transporter solute-binding subunit [Alphaproteobacteria bacterium]|nr:TAXI family TRAP transporter solute-binding subunit [Alphaproteobacteria bacterium]